jgi:CPA1 family monovalent cation:H+ antiporter
MAGHPMSLFELIGALMAVVAMLGYINHRFIRLPDIIGITAAGLLVALALAVVGHYVPAVVEQASALESQFDFREVLFHGLLGPMLFAGSLHIRFADLAKQGLSLAALTTFGVVLSTVFVGLGTHALLRALHVDIALSYCLLFGALISPTDPIAVLGVLKTAGVPKSLETSIAGESLFNDGTGVVTYLVLAGIVSGASEPSLSAVSWLLAQQVVAALGLGLLLGYLGYFALSGVDSFAVEILITVALATGGYGLAEALHMSPLLAVVVIGLVIGNHASRRTMGIGTRTRLFSFWELIDEVLNLVLFALIGVKLLSLHAPASIWIAGALLIPLVLLARVASVGICLLALRPWIVPARGAVAVLSWAGLRGGISLALALSLPDFDGKELFVTATYAVVLFSLLVQGPTLALLLKRLGISTRQGKPAASHTS